MRPGASRSGDCSTCLLTLRAACPPLQLNQRQLMAPRHKKTIKKVHVQLPTLHPNAAGIDIGAREIWVAVPPGSDPNPVRQFETFTDALLQLRDWLIAAGVTSVAMESTGVYWIPLFQILEAAGLEVFFVNARH